MYDLNVSTYLLNLPKRLKIRLYMYSAIYVVLQCRLMMPSVVKNK